MAADGLKPTRNDLDKDGSGRNILDGLMYRTIVATKLTYEVSLLRITADILAQLESDLDGEYVQATLLEAKTNRQVTRTYYNSKVNEGVQRSINGVTYYDGVAFNLIER